VFNFNECCSSDSAHFLPRLLELHTTLSRSQVSQSVKRSLSPAVYSKIKSFYHTKELRLWGLEKGNYFKDDMLNATVQRFGRNWFWSLKRPIKSLDKSVQ
jgi:hypothetical protein